MLLLLACSDSTLRTNESGEVGSDSSAADSAQADSSPVDSTPPTDSSVDSAAQDSGPLETGDTDIEPQTCLEYLADQTGVDPDYAQFSPVLNSACLGTNHQDIAGVQHVVFVGDSITVGTPPTNVEDFYRNLMAADLATRFGIEAPSYDWQWYDLFNGTAYIQDSGAFSVCAKYGGRTDDLVQDNNQIIDCIPEDRRSETTLVVMTVGGNDLFSLVEDYNTGVAVEDLWLQVDDEVQLQREAVEMLREDKEMFPGEMFVVFANVYEFTDGMGNVDACPGAESLGYKYDLAAPELVEMIRYYEEQFMKIAVDAQADMTFMDEAFCGHGYNAEDSTGPCYRTDNRDLWFDLTCFHPNDLGHAAIAEMMLSTVDE